VINTPRSLAVYLLLSNEEWMQYLELPWDPGNYECPSLLADDRLVSEILRKSADLPLGLDLEAKAKATFYEAEDCNRQTNDRLNQTAACDHPQWWRNACLEIDRILGPLYRAALNTIEQAAAHGPGGAVGVRAEGSVVSDKYDAIPSVTRKLEPFAQAIMLESWSEYRPKVQVVEGNEFFTVPKKATARRGCAKGPLLNVYAQLGVGGYIRDRLNLFGVNLRDQSKNQEAARLCYERGGVTLDLSNASELMCLEAVRRLVINDRWLFLLELLREDITVIDKEPVRLEKFCAMGNGFTFPLESLLFWGVMRSVVPRRKWNECAVYGDDMVLPSEYAPALIEALEYLGFKVNHEKSCLAGNFFESCGTDWFKGQNVRPFYLGTTEDSERQLPARMQMANALRLWSARRLNGFGCDARFRPLWKRLLDESDPAVRKCRVPVFAGDVGFISSLREAKPFIRRIRDDPHDGGEGWEGWEYHYLSYRAEELDKRSFGLVLATLSRRHPDPVEGTFPLSHKDISQEILEYARRRVPDGIATRGREPRRGYLRLVGTRWASCGMWPDGFDWV
jgi:hypothetical protein